jgi:hypothetical protein
VNRTRWLVVVVVSVAIVFAVFYAIQPKSEHPTLERNLVVATGTTTVATSPDSPSRAASPSPRAEASSVSPAEWWARFRASNDYLKFVKDALPAAVRGDGRAAWYVKEALSSCALVIRTYHGSTDPQAKLQQQLENMPNAPQWARDVIAERTRRCIGLSQQDPFDGLPERQGGYPSNYWYEQAVADGDPLAKEQTAADAIAAVSVSKNLSETEKAKQIEAVQTNLRAAVQTGDPDALFFAGSLLSDARYSNNPLNGIAVALAACDLGHDCSASNPENAFSNCKLSGACPADADYAYFLQQSLGSDKYAWVYSRALELAQAGRAGNWDSVLAALVIDKHP